MGISPYLASLRSKVGTDLILSPGVTAVVMRQVRGRSEVLLVRRVDNGHWTLISGAIDPGEDPDTAALREVREETTVLAEVARLLWVQMLPISTYPNGDQVQHMDLAFLCNPVEGTATVGDDESSDVRWFDVEQLPPLHPRLVRTIDLARLPAAPPAFGMEERCSSH